MPAWYCKICAPGSCRNLSAYREKVTTASHPAYVCMRFKPACGLPWLETRAMGLRQESNTIGWNSVAWCATVTVELRFLATVFEANII